MTQKKDGEVDPSKFIPIDQFNRAQSGLQAQVAEANRRVKTAEDRATALTNEVEILNLGGGDANNAAIIRARQEAESEFNQRLEELKAREGVVTQAELGFVKKVFVETHGVPAETFEGMHTPAEMESAGWRYLVQNPKGDDETDPNQTQTKTLVADPSNPPTDPPKKYAGGGSTVPSPNYETMSPDEFHAKERELRAQWNKDHPNG